MKYVKVMFGTISGAKKDFEYKLGEVNISNNWNPNADNPKEFGGFNYCDEECILRWLHRGDTIYDVEIPEDAENVKIKGATTIYRTNKIIIKNPRKVTDEMARHFYQISNIPEKSYYKALAAVAVMNYKNTAMEILRDKINRENIDEVLEEWNDFIEHKDKNDRKNLNELIVEIEELLNEIKSDLLISRFVDKEPYIKKITDDKIINLTGQSGSGKSYYAKEHFSSVDYEIIDTDDIFSDKRFLSATGLNKSLGEYFRNKYKELPNLSDDFDLIYNEIINYCKDIDKTIVIDCAQFHCIKDINILKGKVIIIRTCIDTCYNRAISRWIDNHKQNNWDYTEDELIKYKKRKKKIYDWYKFSNEFIKKIDLLSKNNINKCQK